MGSTPYIWYEKLKYDLKINKKRLSTSLLTDQCSAFKPYYGYILVI